MNQKLNLVKLTQWQKDETLFFDTEKLSREKRWSDRILETERWNKFEHSQCSSDEMWKSKMAGGGGNKKRFQYCTNPSGQEILYLLALRGHSGRNLIDPSLKDTALIPNNFFEYIFHVGCAVSLHSITNSELKAGGQNLSNRQTVFFLPADLVDKEHKDLGATDLGAPRRAHYMHELWNKHQNTVYWVDGFKFNQTRSNAIIFYDTLPAHCTPKVVVMNSEEEIIYQRVFVTPRPPPKISYKDKWMNELDSEVAGSSKDTQRIQPKPKIQLSRTERPVGGQESTKEIETLFDHEDVKH